MEERHILRRGRIASYLFYLAASLQIIFFLQWIVSTILTLIYISWNASLLRELAEGRNNIFEIAAGRDEIPIDLSVSLSDLISFYTLGLALIALPKIVNALSREKAEKLAEEHATSARNQVFSRLSCAPKGYHLENLQHLEISLSDSLENQSYRDLSKLAIELDRIACAMKSTFRQSNSELPTVLLVEKWPDALLSISLSKLVCFSLALLTLWSALVEFSMLSADGREIQISTIGVELALFFLAIGILAVIEVDRGWAYRHNEAEGDRIFEALWRMESVLKDADHSFLIPNYETPLLTLGRCYVLSIFSMRYAVLDRALKALVLSDYRFPLKLCLLLFRLSGLFFAFAVAFGDIALGIRMLFSFIAGILVTFSYSSSIRDRIPELFFMSRFGAVRMPRVGMIFQHDRTWLLIVGYAALLLSTAQYGFFTRYEILGVGGAIAFSFLVCFSVQVLLAAFAAEFQAKYDFDARKKLLSVVLWDYLIIGGIFIKAEQISKNYDKSNSARQ